MDKVCGSEEILSRSTANGSLVEHVIGAAQPKHVMLGESTLRPDCLTKGLSRSTTNRTMFDNIKPEQARLENTFKDETKFQRLFILNFRRKAAGRCGGGETVLLSQVSPD